MTFSFCLRVPCCMSLRKKKQKMKILYSELRTLFCVIFLASCRDNKLAKTAGKMEIPTLTRYREPVLVFFFVWLMASGPVSTTKLIKHHNLTYITHQPQLSCPKADGALNSWVFPPTKNNHSIIKTSD